MKIFRSIVALGLVLAIFALFAGCSSNEGGTPSDTAAPVVTESVADAGLTEDCSENDPENSGAPEKPAWMFCLYTLYTLYFLCFLQEQPGKDAGL